MREARIKMCSPTRDSAGMSCSNPEWTICKILFLERIKDLLDWEGFISEIPEDLKCYDREEG